jgi:hypothetical protein
MAFADHFYADGTIEPAGCRQVFPTTVKDVQVGNARVALIQALVQNIRWTDDGQTPTSSFGNRLHAGESMWYTGDLTQFRFIEEASGAEVNIAAYK